jgi:hypothetical protein
MLVGDIFNAIHNQDNSNHQRIDVAGVCSEAVSPALASRLVVDRRTVCVTNLSQVRWQTRGASANTGLPSMLSS